MFHVFYFLVAVSSGQMALGRVADTDYATKQACEAAMPAVVAERQQRVAPNFIIPKAGCFTDDEIERLTHQQGV